MQCQQQTQSIKCKPVEISMKNENALLKKFRWFRDLISRVFQSCLTQIVYGDCAFQSTYVCK
jgi:hypothetical protein